MTEGGASRKQENSLRHDCYMTGGRVGFVSFLDVSDIAAIGLAFYLGGEISNRLIPNPTASILFIVLCTVAAWFINFGIKKRLNPYPKFVEFFFNWWFNGVDYYVPDVDINTTPLIVTREMAIGHSIDHIERQAKRQLTTIRKNERRGRVRKAE